MPSLSTCLLAFGLGCFSDPTAAGPSLIAVPFAAPAPAVAPPAAPVATAPAWRPEKASELLTLVQAFYDATADIKARFTQTYWNPTFASKTVTRGDLSLKKPGMMVWDYEGKTEPDYYADGKKMWVVEHDTRQVVSQDVSANSDLSAAMKFLFGGQHLVTEFKVRYTTDAKKLGMYGDADHHVLELKPRTKNPHYKGLLLQVHATTGRVDSFVVYNQDGSRNAFTLANLTTNVGLTAAGFAFKVPAGYVESRE